MTGPAHHLEWTADSIRIGCSVNDLLEAIRNPYGPSEAQHGKSEQNEENSDENSASRHRTASTIWKWLAGRRDVSVGSNRIYNHLTLDEVLALQPPAPSYNTDKDGEAPDLGSDADQIRVYASEETMWESLTGHAIDYKRVPRSEWLLLLGIASTTSKGILQGDLGRLVDQDKRSVPKRTDALLRKGYIVKRTTLVRGTKTSKMWLKLFAPALPKDGDTAADEPRPDMNITREVLVSNLDPVPWHIRWTGESVDYTALATTILAVTKEWGVLRVSDLKAKLGVLGMRWQMKVLAKVCRWLNARGVIQYVAAKLGDKVFKDCIKFGRDLDPEDWTLFLATGKRTKRPGRNTDFGAGEGSDLPDPLLSQSADGSEISSAPPWVPDKPLSATIAELIRQSADTGLTNPSIYGMTLGSSFSRYISSLTTALATPDLQPSHLQHLQISSEHTRMGKIASYRYFARRGVTSTTDTPASELTSDQVQKDAGVAFGFAALSELKLAAPSSTLSNLCSARLSSHKPNGRPKKGKTAQVVTEAVETPKEVVSDSQENVTKAPRKKSESKAPREPPKTSLFVTLKVSPKALKDLIGEDIDQTNMGRSSRPRRTRSKAQTIDVEMTDAIDIAEADEIFSEGLPETRKKRGRGRRGGDLDTAPRPWKCEKCGGSWKNDIGLKYHLEKSRTPCNPTFDESEPTSRRTTRYSTPEPSPPAPAEESPPTPITNRRNSPMDPNEATSKTDADKTHGNSSTTQSREKGTPFQRPSISLGGGPFHTSSDWRRVVLDRQGQDTIAKANDGALVNSVDSQPRSVLARPRPDIRSTPKSSPARASGRKDNTVNGKASSEPHGSPTAQAVDVPLPGRIVEQDRVAENSLNPTELPPVQTNSNDHGKLDVVSETPAEAAKGKSHEDTDATHMLFQTTLSRSVMNLRIGEIIKDLLSGQDGMFPGGKVLWHVIETIWAEKYPGDAVPTVKACQAGLRELIKKKEANEHWHAFRDDKGMFSKCQIVIQSKIDPFSPKAMELVEKIKEVFPQLYMPPPFAAPPDALSGKEGRRGRRNLVGEVEVLNAPIYAAQVVAKRRLKDGDRSSPSPKRLKQDMKSSNREIASPRGRKRSQLQQIYGGTKYRNTEPDWDDLVDPALSQTPAEEIKFLVPNTYLDEDPPGFDYKSHRHWKGFDAFAGRNRQSSAGGGIERMIFDDTICISGSDGLWPHLETQYFEDRDTSFTLDGWMPDAAWFSWASIVQDVERRTSALNGRRRHKRGAWEEHRRFINSLVACLDVEESWADTFISAPERAAGPYNTFVRLFSGPFDALSVPGPIAWPNQGQFTLDSYPKFVQEYGDGAESDSDGDDLLDDLRHQEALLELERPEPLVEQIIIQSEYNLRSKVKRVTLAARSLTDLPYDRGDSRKAHEATGNGTINDPDRMIAAFVAVRVLLGGSDKAIDWGLLLQLFPDLGLTALRRFWIDMRKQRGAYIAKFTKDFQDKFLVAYEKDELPEFDFDDPLDYDWPRLIEWTMKIPRKSGLELPATRALLDESYSSQAAPCIEDDWQDKFFHVQASVFSRFEWATAMPAVVTLDETSTHQERGFSLDDLDVAKSWVRSLCCTDETKYTVQQIKDKFSTLGPDSKRNKKLVQQAIDQLTQERIICKSRKPVLGGRPYRLNEYFTYMVAKLSQTTKYLEATAFKASLDAAFRRGETVKVPYTLDDGSVMALTNLNATGRIRLVPVDVPNIPFGFEPGNYESRKFPKSYYHFNMEAVPSETYQYNEDIEVLKATIQEGPPSGSSRGELPQWIDFVGKKDARRWMEILGAFCFMYATRGFLTTQGICSALKPVLEEYEARVIIDWGKKTGVLKDAKDGLGITVGEWWWLAVPWQVQSG